MLLLHGLKYKSKIFSLFFVILDLHDTVVLFVMVYTIIYLQYRCMNNAKNIHLDVSRLCEYLH